MTTSLNAHRLLKEYQSLAAAGYPGGRQAFVELADLAHACLANVTLEQRLPAMVVQNAFDALSKDAGGEAGPTVSPELHEALVNAMKFVITGGDETRCMQLSKQLIRVFPKWQDS